MFIGNSDLILCQQSDVCDKCFLLGVSFESV